MFTRELRNKDTRTIIFIYVFQTAEHVLLLASLLQDKKEIGWLAEMEPTIILEKIILCYFSIVMF